MKNKMIYLLCIMMLTACLSACVGHKSTQGHTEKKQNSLQGEETMDLSYADQFSIKKYQDGYRLLEIGDGCKYLVVPENKEVPNHVAKDVVILHQPLNRIYLVATSAMDMIRAVDGISSIRLSGTKTSDWYIKEAKTAMEQGTLLYAGKYNAPDYEKILAEECDLAVESTMIYHSPEVKEELEKFGIPVFVERSSYEKNPLGRLEWIKVYGVLLGKEQEAEEYFEQELTQFKEISNQKPTGKTVAFFSVNSNGSVTVRKSDDYVSKMIEMAGGTYIFQKLDNENELSTVNMQMEQFYADAKDADILIYNSAIEGEIESMDVLYDKSSLFRDFKAVNNKEVYCTSNNLFQKSTGIGGLIRDMNHVFTNPDTSDSELEYLRKIIK